MFFVPLGDGSGLVLKCEKLLFAFVVRVDAQPSYGQANFEGPAEYKDIVV